LVGFEVDELEYHCVKSVSNEDVIVDSEISRESVIRILREAVSPNHDPSIQVLHPYSRTDQVELQRSIRKYNGAFYVESAMLLVNKSLLLPK